MRPRRNLFAYDSPFARDKPTIIVDNSEIILLYRKWRTQAKGTEGNCWKTFNLSYNRFTHQNLHCTRVKSENMQLKLNNINIGPLMIKSFTEFVGNQCKK